VPTVVIDQTIEIEYPDNWTILKWDDTEDYRSGIQRLSGSKAADLLALGRSPRRELMIIEVKDFSGHLHDNQGRLGVTLAIEVGQKIRDTVAALVGLARCQPEVAESRVWAEGLLRRDTYLRIVLWLEMPTSPLPAREKRINALQVHQQLELRKRLTWLGRGNYQVLVCNSSSPSPFLSGRRI